MTRRRVARGAPEPVLALDRRQLIVATLVAAGLPSIPLRAAAAWSAAVPADADWSIDDMWGVYPRYAEPIAYPRRNGQCVRPDDVDASWCD